MLNLLMLDYGIDHGYGGDVHDVVYRCLPVGEVDGFVQTHLDGAYHLVGVAHRLEQLVGLVGAGEVGEYEGVHLFALELVE